MYAYLYLVKLKTGIRFNFFFYKMGLKFDAYFFIFCQVAVVIMNVFSQD